MRQYFSRLWYDPYPLPRFETQERKKERKKIYHVFNVRKLQLFDLLICVYVCVHSFLVFLSFLGFEDPT